jgi:flagellar motility protein MotE (MotC chaperone)
MAIEHFVLAKEGPGEDPSKKRIQRLDEQVKQARELLKKAKESDPKSERVFNLNQRVNTLTTQKDRLKKRADDRKETEKEEKAGVDLGNGIRCKCIKKRVHTR